MTIRNPHIGRLPYAPETLGSVRVECDAKTVAGSMATVRITYTAGKFGIDDQGSVRFLLRFASDAGRPQFDRPGAPNYCTATASNGSTLLLEYHPRGAFRPWFKAIRVNVMRDALVRQAVVQKSCPNAEIAITSVCAVPEPRACPRITSDA